MVKRDDTLVLRTVPAEVGRVLQSPTPTVEEKLVLLADYVSDAFGEMAPLLYQWRVWLPQCTCIV
jgi:hypothetical protein